MASVALSIGAQSKEKTPIDLVNDALRGSVIDILRSLIPTLQPYNNDEAFNVILNSPEMTARSFRAFRENPGAFADLLRGPENQPITNDNEPLSCGRTLAQVVSLIVQAVAKRYFRAKLGLKRSASAAPDTPTGLIDRLTQLLKPNPPPPKAGKIASPSDRLFNAMRDYLLFEWQLRLIPHYVGLPVSLVHVLGSRILEFREIEDIQWMVRTGQPLPAPSPREADQPAQAATMQSAPAEQSETASPSILLKPDSVPAGVDSQRYVAAVLGRVNVKLAKRLMQDLGLNPRQLAVVLLRAYEVLPKVEYQRFGTSAPDSHEANRFIAAALTSRFGQKTDPTTCAEFARLYLANARSAV